MRDVFKVADRMARDLDCKPVRPKAQPEPRPHQRKRTYVWRAPDAKPHLVIVTQGVVEARRNDDSVSRIDVRHGRVMSTNEGRNGDTKMKISNVVFGICVVLIGIAGVAAFMAIVVALVMVPDKFSDATIVKICRDGTRVYRLPDGVIMIRRDAFQGYAVEDVNTLCQ
jgi:hypothetical protein